jgi:hypothetical protein
MDGVGQEPPRPSGDLRHRRQCVDDLLGGRPVGGEVVLAAQPVIPHPRAVGHVRVEFHETEA